MGGKEVLGKGLGAAIFERIAGLFVCIVIRRDFNQAERQSRRARCQGERTDQQRGIVQARIDESGSTIFTLADVPAIS